MHLYYIIIPSCTPARALAQLLRSYNSTHNTDAILCRACVHYIAINYYIHIRSCSRRIFIMIFGYKKNFTDGYIFFLVLAALSGAETDARLLSTRRRKCNNRRRLCQ